MSKSQRVFFVGVSLLLGCQLDGFQGLLRPHQSGRFSAIFRQRTVLPRGHHYRYPDSDQCSGVTRPGSVTVTAAPPV